MYKIYIDNGSGLKIFFKPNADELKLIDVIYKPVMGSAGTLEFSVPATHSLYNEIEPLVTEFWLYKDSKPIFRGRYAGSIEDFNKTGQITVEGDLNYLIDSILDPYEFKGSISSFFQWVINCHNGMVEKKKQFKIGRCTVVDSNNYIARSNEEYSTSIEALKGKLVDTHGGYLRVRYESDGNYIDYVTDYGGVNSQKIRFGENLLDVSKNIDTSQIITCLIPVGAEIEGTEERGVKGRVDISSVNGGKKYIINDEGVKRFGKIWGTYAWDDVTLPSNLLTKARAYLAEQIILPQVFTLTAFDLSLIDTNIDDFDVGYWTTIESKPHNMRGTYLIHEANIDITTPENSTITLNGSVPTISYNTAKQIADASRRVDQLANDTSDWINEAVDSATKLIQGGLGGYVVMTPNASTGFPEEILIMDSPSKTQAKNVIRLNRNGIGFSTSGYNGTYRNAWTIDGNLVADFITTGTMSADRMRGGSLALGGSKAGKYKNGSLYVYNDKNEVIGSWTSAGISLNKGSFTGTTINGSTITGSTINGGSINGTTITGTTIQNATSGNRLVIDKTSSLKGYSNSSLVNLVNVGQSSGGQSQMTLDARNQLNIRTPRIVVEQASHGESSSTGTVTYSGSYSMANVIGKYYEGEESPTGSFPGADPTEILIARVDENNNIIGHMLVTMPVYLKMEPTTINTINGFVTSAQSGQIYPI